jgi:hypothetical protein
VKLAAPGFGPALKRLGRPTSAGASWRLQFAPAGVALVAASAMPRATSSRGPGAAAYAEALAGRIEISVAARVYEASRTCTISVFAPRRLVACSVRQLVLEVENIGGDDAARFGCRAAPTRTDGFRDQAFLSPRAGDTLHAGRA